MFFPYVSRILLLCLGLGLALLPLPSLADRIESVTAIHMVADPQAPSGYREAGRWEIPPEEEWVRIHNNIGTFKKQKAEEANPFLHKVPEMVVLSQKDRNGVTGEDFYLTPNGIMRVTRKPFDSFYKDQFEFKKFLEEELGRRVNYTEAGFSDIPLEAPGIVVTYDVNDTLKNPMWQITKPEEIKVYDGFFRGLVRLVDDAQRSAAEDYTFNEMKNFMVYLNYKNSPARFATVTPKFIRLTRVGLQNFYYEDPDKYFQYFITAAHDQAMSGEERKKKRMKDAVRRQF